MEKAYIILAHKNPEQVARLLTALDDNHSTFFLHLDKNVDATQFRNINMHRNNLVAVKSIATPWGGFGLVEATLHALKAVTDHRKHFDFISLISGQHYPTQSNSEIQDYLSNTPNRSFMEYTTIPNHERWKPRGGLYRIDSYFFGLSAIQRYKAKTFNFLSKKVGLFKRQFPENMVPYCGSQWWTIDRQSLTYILNFIKKNEAYVSFQKQTFAADELFFHNILLNADNDDIREGVVNDNLLYMNWSNQRKSHPEILGTDDFKNIIGNQFLFARKFDIEQDALILDMIDDHRAS